MCEDLVYPPAIHIDDFEPPAFGLDGVADIRDRSELLKQESRGGLIGARSRKGYAEQFRKFDRGHPARYQVGAVPALDEGGLRRPFLGMESADDRLQDVRAGHDALEDAVLVMDEPHMYRR